MMYKLIAIIASISIIPAFGLAFITSFAIVHMMVNGRDIPPSLIGWCLLGIGISFGLFRLIFYTAKNI